eukprot:m.378841 g.378841  ORF g.378841 m.378841 type:complete len:52 (+) comp95792_c0_seq1:137-292(+)
MTSWLLEKFEINTIGMDAVTHTHAHNATIAIDTVNLQASQAFQSGRSKPHS